MDRTDAWDRDHELSAVLADETRYHIYRAIAEQPGTDVTVADIAERFSLHPNVARMHLTKLEHVGFLATGLRRTAGGGRPAKLYRLSDRVMSFGFPPRRYELLARLALEALAAGGSRNDAVRACREAGVEEGRSALAREDTPPRNPTAVADLVRQIAEKQGLLPDIEWQGDTMIVSVRNCAFNEVSSDDPDLVCPLHRAFLEGVLRAVTSGLGELEVTQSDCHISRGGDRCELICTVVPGSRNRGAQPRHGSEGGRQDV
ncbi:MAG: helix-turn-helix domain-containing protein [Thermoleophilia bacterium]